MRPAINTASSRVTDSVLDDEDFAVGKIGWVEGIMAKPDEEAMSQVTARMYAQFTAILRHPEPTNRALLTDLDLFFSAGHSVPALTEIKRRLLYADQEVPETEQDTLISQAKAGLLDLYSNTFGSRFEATHMGGGEEGDDQESEENGKPKDRNGCEGARDLK